MEHLPLPPRRITIKEENIIAEPTQEKESEQEQEQEQ